VEPTLAGLKKYLRARVVNRKALKNGEKKQEGWR